MSTRRQFQIERGWTVSAWPTLERAVRSLPAKQARVWVLVDHRDVEAARRLASAVELVCCLPAGATMMERCRTWELGASAVLVAPWPREILAAVRAGTRRRFFVPVKGRGAADSEGSATSNTDPRNATPQEP